MIIKSKLSLCICFLLSLTLPLFAQQGFEAPNVDQLDVIKIDLDKGTISSAFPFDKKFKLEITSKKYKLSNELDIIPMKYKNGKKQAFSEKECDTMIFNSNTTPATIQAKFDTILAHTNKKIRRLVKRDSFPVPIITYTKNIALDYKQNTKRIEIVNIKLPYDKKEIKKHSDNSDSIVELYNDKPKFKKQLDSIILEHGNGSFDVSRSNIIYPTSGKIKYLNVNLEKSGDNTYRCIMPALEPNTLYELVFTKQPTKKEINHYYEIIYLSSTIPNQNKAHLKYLKNIKTLESNQNRSIPFKSVKEDYNDFLTNSFPLLNNNIGIYKASEQGLITAKKTIDSVFFKPWDQVLIQSVGNIVQSKKLNLSLFSAITNEFLKPENKQIEIYTGQKSFGNKKIKELNNYQKRKDILIKNIKNLDSLITELSKVIVSVNSNQSITLRNKLIKSRIFANSILAELKKFESYMASQIKSEISFYNPVSSTTSNPNLKTRNSQVIVPDFGFLVSRQINSQGEVTIIPRPTVGFNIHFGGIDKNIPLKYLENKNLFRHNLSLAFGITVGKIDEGTYTDLFNGISPYLGINYRIDKQIRLGAGALFVNDTDINPITDEKIFDPGIYVMVSFDFENLFSQLGKVAAKIIN